MMIEQPTRRSEINHVHTLEPREGRTVVRTDESFEGPIARLFS
jgi:hypothetical protein